MVGDRDQLASFLDQRMQSAHAQIRDSKRLDPDTSVVKTYILECHNPNLRDSILDPKALQKRLQPSGFRTQVQEADQDRDLAIIRASRDGREEVLLFLDHSNPRYWLLHSVSRSEDSNRFAQYLVLGAHDLDVTWFPTEFLYSIERLGPFQGLRLSFDRSFLGDSSGGLDYLKVALWGRQAKEVLQYLTDESGFPHVTSLHKVGVRFALEDDSHFSVTEVRFDGRTSARGTSFDAHIALISHLVQRYEVLIAALEANASIRFEQENDNNRIDGCAVSFVFGEPINNVSRFCSRVFSGSRPFRLLGVVRDVNARSVSISAVDLHIGKQINFDVGEDIVRLYLPEGACGNTVARFYTNLQRHFDARVTAYIGSEESRFALQP